ncbi:right-handed parallel beta-helix repeat-containing protein [Streptomyces sp. NBC_01220]|uniref:right-handed parallel beta-helix repeat-containing protein n=1 Tax=Streptomyces sp. NBC_01220 TaxID=2903781 RepID=UPI00352FB3F7|nr:right-handed parallel beta-helix repeat-containing protein [Streptomyces sp. NBC_01220]
MHRTAAMTALAAAIIVAAGSACTDTPHYAPPPATYYVSPGGNDRNSGTSPGEAWRTLRRAEGTALEPGNRLMLQGGARFTGTLTVGKGEAGDADRPVVIGSYGTGRATVAATDGPGISVHDTAGVEIRNLAVTGKDGSYLRDGGINLYSDLPDGKKLDHVAVSGVEVSGFRAGIAIGGTGGGSGFENVTVSRSELHDNRDVGLLTYGPDFDAAHPTYAHSRIRIVDVAAYHNTGDPASTTTHSGNGIVLGSVRDATVRDSHAHDNGTRAAAEAPAGPVGIWAYDATGILLEHNTSYRNHTGSRVDGAGFGLDSNVSDSTVQYNLAFQNDGPGYYAYTSKRNGAHRDNTIRYNISADNGRKLPAKGSLAVYGKDVRSLDVYQNTLVVPRSPNGPGPAILLRAGLSHVTVRNNVLVADSAPLIVAAKGLTPRKVLLQGNNYSTASGSWNVDWAGRTYAGLAAWRTATGQERVGATPSGTTTGPCFAGGALPRIRSAEDAPLIIPDCAAPVGAGLDLHALFGTDPGAVDYFGRASGTPPPVGAAVPVVKD